MAHGRSRVAFAAACLSMCVLMTACGARASEPRQHSAARSYILKAVAKTLSTPMRMVGEYSALVNIRSGFRPELTSSATVIGRQNRVGPAYTRVCSSKPFPRNPDQRPNCEKQIRRGDREALQEPHTQWTCDRARGPLIFWGTAPMRPNAWGYLSLSDYQSFRFASNRSPWAALAPSWHT
jgi:hypothetical protein